MKFHLDMTSPKADQIFVFGSNLSGIHGAGAARAATKTYGAVWGVGEGFTGSCYALPTKDANIDYIDTMQVNEFVCNFIDAVKENMDKNYFITRVGCGLAGFSDEEIAPMFQELFGFENCDFPVEWKPFAESV